MYKHCKCCSCVFMEFITSVYVTISLIHMEFLAYAGSRVFAILHCYDNEYPIWFTLDIPNNKQI